MKDFLKKNWWIIATFVLMAIKINMMDAKIRYTEHVYETILASIEEQNGVLSELNTSLRETLGTIREANKKLQKQ